MLLELGFKFISGQKNVYILQTSRNCNFFCKEPDLEYALIIFYVGPGTNCIYLCKNHFYSKKYFLYTANSL